MTTNLGKRIKFFRNRASMSQLELETETGNASGVISRIENNQVNPTKETILNIAKTLKLNNREMDYLIGHTAEPVTQKEIDLAKKEVKAFLSQRGRLAYLLDDRWRYYMISDTFKKLLRIKPWELEYVMGKTTAEVIVLETSPVIERLNQTHYKELLQIYLSLYYSYMSFMNDDKVYQRTVNEINRNPISREIWNDITSQNKREFTTHENRIIYFDLLGKKFPLRYSFQPLVLNSRFYLAEFNTDNKILNFLPKLL